jgi:hypothetical protein
MRGMRFIDYSQIQIHVLCVDAKRKKKKQSTVVMIAL